MTGPALERVRQLLDASRYHEAEVEARRLLASDPGRIDALTALARALVGQDRASEAMGPASEACRLDPADVDALLVLSDTALHAAQPGQAVEVAEWAVTLAPHMSATHYALGAALLLGTRQVRRATEEADEALRLAPHSADAHNLKGMCLGEAGGRKAARAEFQQALALEPHHSAALSNLAGLDVALNPAGAARRFSAAAALDPQNPTIHANLGVAAHNFAFQMRWLIIIGGLVEALLALSGVGRPWRTVVFVALCALILAAVVHFLAQLPRGYRASPRFVLARIGVSELAGVVVFGLLVFLLAAATFGDESTMKRAGGRLLLITIVWGGSALYRSERDRSGRPRA